MTAVQELTRAAYQARVLALLEAIASAMPGVGFLLGGAIAAIFAPRASFAVAGAGVLAVALLAVVALRRADWTVELEPAAPEVKPGRLIPPPASSVAHDEPSRTALTDR